MMHVGISSIGLITAQGSKKEIVHPAPLQTVGKLQWEPSPWTTCHHCRPALGVDPTLSGKARWQKLATLALQDCLNGNSVPSGTPLVVASSNGTADKVEGTTWNDAFVTRDLFKD